jgi:hypothetical protein
MTVFVKMNRSGFLGNQDPASSLQDPDIPEWIFPGYFCTGPGPLKNRVITIPIVWELWVSTLHPENSL